MLTELETKCPYYTGKIPNLKSNGRRAVYIAGLIVSLIIGIASRRYHLLQHEFGKFPGDVLWASAVFFGTGMLLPRVPVARIGLYATVFAVFIELLKLVNNPVLASLRRNSYSALIFGHVFSVPNVLCYVIGIVGASLIASAIFARRRNAL